MRQRQRPRLRDARPVAAARAGLSQLLRTQRALRAPAVAEASGLFLTTTLRAINGASTGPARARARAAISARCDGRATSVRIPDGFKN